MNRQKLTRKKRGGGFFGPDPISQQKSDTNDISLFVFPTKNMSTEPNIDSSYKQIGIIHFTDSGSVNALRQFATGVANIFGKKGFDNTIYDKIRNNALTTLSSKIQQNQKACNIRMEFENTMQDTIFIHIYGTLYQKQQQQQPKQLKY
jgi:hypothetical protein